MPHAEWPLQPFRVIMLICLDADPGSLEWCSQWSQGREKDKASRDPDPSQNKGWIWSRAPGVLLVGAGSHSTLGELAAKLLVVGKLQKVFVSRGRATA